MVTAPSELRPDADEPKVWLTSPESLVKLLSNRNRALLTQIAKTYPTSLHQLAASTGRTPGNPERTLKAMERYGLVDALNGERDRLGTEVPCQDVRLEMSMR
jgi:predicted transcriptional regulator